MQINTGLGDFLISILASIIAAVVISVAVKFFTKKTWETVKSAAPFLGMICVIAVVVYSAISIVLFFTKSEKEVLEEKINLSFEQSYPELAKDNYQLRVILLKPTPLIAFDDTQVSSDKKVNGMSEFKAISTRAEIKDKISRVFCEEKCKNTQNCGCKVEWGDVQLLVPIEDE